MVAFIVSLLIFCKEVPPVLVTTPAEFVVAPRLKPSCSTEFFMKVTFLPPKSMTPAIAAALEPTCSVAPPLKE
jgi:hypothetical protein